MKSKLEKLEQSFKGLYMAVGKIIEGNEVQGELNGFMHDSYNSLKKTLGNCYILVNNIEKRLYKIEKELNARDSIKN